jgi:hypothetical protein
MRKGLGEHVSTYDITGNQFSRQDCLLDAITDSLRADSNVSLQTSDDICGLLFLVETDEGVEEQDSDDDGEIDPVVKTKSQQSSNFHDYGAAGDGSASTCSHLGSEVWARVQGGGDIP